MAEHCPVWRRQQKPAHEKRRDEGAKATISNKYRCPFNLKSSVAWQEQLSRAFEGREKERREGKWNRPRPSPHIIPPQDVQSLYWLKQHSPWGHSSFSSSERRSIKRDFPLSASETGQRVSVDKPSHMCLPAPGLVSVGEHKAAALIKFPWSLPNLRDQWGDAVRESMPLPAASLCHQNPVWLRAILLPPHLYLPPASLFPSLILEGDFYWLGLIQYKTYCPYPTGTPEGLVVADKK